MCPGAPSPAVNGSKEIGLFVVVIGSLYLRPQYNKLLALVKEPFDLDHCRSGSCAWVTEELRSSPEADIEDRLKDRPVPPLQAPMNWGV
jgi:hypothetical protein